MNNYSDIPVRFAIELARHPEILNNLSGMSRQEQEQIIDGARQFSSRDEIRNYVETIKIR